ncbi:hypothetical protein IWQ60_008620 [Tieghemiomyces parasiticus]|uniref:Uncharacterized protein n=1 Tax=Tieghemiomyces parasiticus TaxID=78921 RepID=A0A9W7ZZC3_9FUNG|nr:hypothetical protein IWQ60_008620 [Tieghemiomyces parasiticus]
MSALNLAKRGVLVYQPLTRSSILMTSRVMSAQAPSTSSGQSEIAQRARAHRPLSPDLSIYQPQLTWYMSSFHRVTGAFLAAGLYAGAISYVAAPVVLGMSFDSASIVSAFAALSPAAKFSAKMALALPFTFHSYNGIRHLIWDTGRALTLKGVYTGGYAVLGATALTSAILAAI